MNKSELVAAVQKATELKKKDAEAAVVAFVDTVKEALKKGEKVQLIGFGTFEAKKRPARVARNPRTGQEIKVKASKAPTFKASKAFKDSLNSK
ncbi:MAG: HU family DNA-binding protein [Clostridiales bacterium]|nr:HU family DNA-binding protein [Clostridiales bacterium]